MKTYEIWSEGFRATGDVGYAQRMGTAQGNTFREACINFAKTNKPFRAYFGEKNLTHWGCRLFDNENDARKAFV